MCMCACVRTCVCANAHVCAHTQVCTCTCLPARVCTYISSAIPTASSRKPHSRLHTHTQPLTTKATVSTLSVLPNNHPYYCYLTPLTASPQAPCLLSQSSHCYTLPDRLFGLVVKASASRVEGPGFESRLRRDFFQGRVIPVT